MSQARKINDHSFWAGKGMSKDSVLPTGVHVKHDSSAEGAGALGTYEDKSEDIRAVQEKSKSKISGHASKPMYRN